VDDEDLAGKRKSDGYLSPVPAVERQLHRLIGPLRCNIDELWLTLIEYFKFEERYKKYHKACVKLLEKINLYHRFVHCYEI